MKRLEVLIPKFYPEHSIETLAETGGFYIMCFTPSPSPERSKTRSLRTHSKEHEGEIKERDMEQEDRDSTLDDAEITMPELSKKEGKRAISDSDLDGSSTSTRSPRCALLSSSIATGGST